MELTSLPGDGGEASLACGFEAGVIVGNDQPHAMESAFLQTGEKLAPVDLGLGEFATDAKDRTFAIGADAHGHQQGSAEDGSAAADLLIAGIENQIGEGR